MNFFCLFLTETIKSVEHLDACVAGDTSNALSK